MENGFWQQAVDRFLADWRDRPEVTGALVCGSYVTGDPSVHSDLDLHIILQPDCPWRERGNRWVHGFHIEYFANPVGKHREYAAEDEANRRTVNNHMFATGKLLFDTSGDLTSVVKQAQKDLELRENEGFPRTKGAALEIVKYQLWDMRDNLEEAFEAAAPDFVFIAHCMLRDLADAYGAYLGYHELPVYRMGRLLRDQSQRRKYRFPDYPDADFAKRLLCALSLTDPEELMAAYSGLSTHVLGAMGGFSVDGWSLRSEV